jgi:hypothetical protein
MSVFPFPSKPQQIHHTQLFPALGAKIIDILNTDVRLPSVIHTPSVIPAPLFVIPVETGIQTIRQLRCGVDTHSINLRFLKTSFAGFH